MAIENTEDPFLSFLQGRPFRKSGSKLVLTRDATNPVIHYDPGVQARLIKIPDTKQHLVAGFLGNTIQHSIPRTLLTASVDNMVK